MFRGSGSKARSYKAGINSDDSRRRRNQVTVSLRKSQRIEQLEKRRMLTSSTDTAVQGLNAIGQDQQVVANINDLNNYVQMSQSQDQATRLQGTLLIRKLLSVESNPPLQQVIDTGVIPSFIQFLTDFNDTKLQFEACWALTNIASGSSSQTKLLVKLNAIPLIANLLNTNDEKLIEQAVWALSNIAGDGPKNRDKVLECGTMQKLCDVVYRYKTNLSMLRNATWAMSNLCRGKDKPKFDYVKPAIPIVCGLVMSMDDEETVTDACWALSYLADDHSKKNSQIQSIIETGVLPRLIKCLDHKSEKVVVPALRAIGNVVTGDDHQTDAAVQSEVIPALLRLTVHRNKNVRKESCWTLSNIAAGTQTQIGSLLMAGGMDAISKVITNDVFDVQKEAAWTLSNMTNGGVPDQVRHIVNQKGINALVKLLEIEDVQTLSIALEGIENILELGAKDAIRTGGDNEFRNLLEECGGLDAIELCQEHENEKIYDKAVYLIKTYLGDDDCEEENDPSTSTPFNFAAQAPVEWANKPFQFNAQAPAVFGQQKAPNTSTTIQPSSQGFSFGQNIPQPQFTFGQ